MSRLTTRSFRLSRSDRHPTQMRHSGMTRTRRPTHLAAASSADAARRAFQQRAASFKKAAARQRRPESTPQKITMITMAVPSVSSCRSLGRKIARYTSESRERASDRYIILRQAGHYGEIKCSRARCALSAIKRPR